MIDLHCHILPNLDDGAKTTACALKMIKLAQSDGISHIVMTPHIHPGRYDNKTSNISEEFEKIQLLTKDENIDIKLGMAAEVRMDPMIKEMIEEKTIPYIGKINGKDILLIEMPHNHISDWGYDFLRWLLDRDIIPLIAHPERNKGIMRCYDELKPLLEMQCLMQVTAGSVTGNFGHESYKVAQQMLESGIVDVLASDAHNTQYRPPELKAGMDAAVGIVGKKAAMSLVYDNPMKLANSQFSNEAIDIVL